MIYRPWIPIFMTSILTCSLCSHLTAQVEFNQKYNLKDLEALERENNPEEFILHVYDVRPSERGDLWKKMYDNMACGFIDKRIKAKDYSKKTFTEIEEMAKSPFLYKEEVLQFKRNIYAKNFFRECYLNEANKQQCEKELENYWETSNKDPDMAQYIVAKLEENDTKIDTWPIYKVIINDPVSPIYCKKPEIQRAILKKLSSLTFKEDFAGDYKKLIEKNISQKCFKELHPTLKEALVSIYTKSIDKEQALNLLEAQGQLNSEDHNLYLLIYLLDAPVVGPKLNQAWAMVSSIGENAKQRESLLTKLKSLELIPDQTFNDPLSTRHKAIINHLAHHFPELLNYYADNCIRFLNKKENTHVSSSVQCHQFLASSKTLYDKNESHWISDTLRIQYSAIKK